MSGRSYNINVSLKIKDEMAHNFCMKRGKKDMITSRSIHRRGKGMKQFNKHLEISALSRQLPRCSHEAVQPDAGVSMAAVTIAAGRKTFKGQRRNGDSQ